VAHATRENLGYLLAKASQRWNELLQDGFAQARHPEVRASYGSVLIPLLEEDGLRMGEIARRARLSKQTMTSMVRLCERDGLVERRTDPDDGRATRVHLTVQGPPLPAGRGARAGSLERDARRSLGEPRLAELRWSLKELS
jgi:MarR family